MVITPIEAQRAYREDPDEGNKDGTRIMRAKLQGEDGDFNLPTLEERRARSDLVTTFNFLEVINDVDSEQFSERCRDIATKGHMKLSKTF